MSTNDEKKNEQKKPIRQNFEIKHDNKRNTGNQREVPIKDVTSPGHKR